jgi:hypothetical protein
MTSNPSKKVENTSGKRSILTKAKRITVNNTKKEKKVTVTNSTTVVASRDQEQKEETITPPRSAHSAFRAKIRCSFDSGAKRTGRKYSKVNSQKRERSIHKKAYDNRGIFVLRCYSSRHVADRLIYRA